MEIREYLPYDPTNGIFSQGDILASSGLSPGVITGRFSRMGEWERCYEGYRRR